MLSDAAWCRYTAHSVRAVGQALGCGLLSGRRLRALTQALTWERTWSCRGPGFPAGGMWPLCAVSSCCPQLCWTQTWSRHTAAPVSPRSCSSHILVSKGSDGCRGDKVPGPSYSSVAVCSLLSFEKAASKNLKTTGYTRSQECFMVPRACEPSIARV